MYFFTRKPIKPVLGLDADGVVIDWFTPFIDFINIKLGKDYRYDDSTDHDLAITFGIEAATMQRLNHEFQAAYCNFDFRPIPGALEYLPVIAEKYELVIITGRADIYQHGTRGWFDRHVSPGLRVFFTQGFNNRYGGGNERPTKMEVAREVGAVFMIEDSEHELMEWDPEAALPICFPQPWNRELANTHSHIPRLTWPEITELVMA